MVDVRCTRCGKPYPKTGAPFKCECGGSFDFINLPAFSGNEIDPLEHGLWKYHRLMGFDADIQRVTLGEGNTALLPLSISGEEIYLKLEYQNPTASYKDRGSTALISFLKSREVIYAVEDSSGNAGASFAAYAARAGIQARVYVPSTASGPKRAQIEAYGAELVEVPGPRSEAARAVLAEVEKGAVYASHAYMPFGLAGIATIAYEIVQQLGQAPGTIIAPIGHGGLMYGLMKGFEAMVAGSAIREEPYYLGVQSSACAPVAAAFKNGIQIPTPITPAETIAEGVKVGDPVRGQAILYHIHSTRGKIVTVEDHHLLDAYHSMARSGFFVEPTSALVIAAISGDVESLPKPIVGILTGAGIKTKSY